MLATWFKRPTARRLPAAPAKPTTPPKPEQKRA